MGMWFDVPFAPGKKAHERYHISRFLEDFKRCDDAVMALNNVKH